MRYLKAYESFDNKSPEGVKLYCDDLLAELRDDNFKTSVEVSGKWLKPLSMRDKSYVKVHIRQDKNVNFSHEGNPPFDMDRIENYIETLISYLSELGFKLSEDSKIIRTDRIVNPTNFHSEGFRTFCDLWFVRDEPEETNEELKYQSYQSASDKLSKLGHVKRSAELKKWADEIKKRESDLASKRSEEDAKQLGTFQMRITGNKQNIEGNFYISFYFNTDTINQQLDNWYDGGQLWFEFPLAVIPADGETKAKMIEFIEPTNGKPYHGKYYFESMYLNFSKAIILDSEETKKSWVAEPTGSISMEDYGEFYPIFSNRSSAVKFKKALIDVFDGEIILGETDKDPGGVKGMVMDELCSERDRTLGEFIKFIDSLRKININSLYKD